MLKNTRLVLFALLLIGTLVPVVSIQPVKAWNGTVYIHADGSIDPSTAPIQKNGNLYMLTGDIVSDGDGIIIERSSMLIDGNGYVIQGNYGGNGLSLTSISDVAIRNANVYGFYYGVFLVSTSQNTISGNNITTNDIGVVLISSSDYNNVVGNNVKQNNAYGFYVDSSSYNNIYHNNFADNMQQAYTSYSTNIWDHGYPAGGNYWSDYFEPDFYSGPFQNETGGDGIGDAPYVIDVSNIDNYPLINPYVGSHDIGIINISASKTVVCQGYSANITVTISNYGSFTESFTATAYANTTAVQTKNVTLGVGASAALVFVWNSTGFTKGNYTTYAYASLVFGENNIEDNNLTGGWIIISMIGDITGTGNLPDGKCDAKDVALIASLFGVRYTDPRYKPNCDIVYDGKIDAKDVSLVAKSFGKKDP
jgi:parallel beta-helix repeat protein